LEGESSIETRRGVEHTRSTKREKPREITVSRREGREERGRKDDANFF
jgi:hypothetical protein